MFGIPFWNAAIWVIELWQFHSTLQYEYPGGTFCKVPDNPDVRNAILECSNLGHRTLEYPFNPAN
jgi:hypothetical protein